MGFKQAYLLTLSIIFAIALGFIAGFTVNRLLNEDADSWPILHQAANILEDHGIKGTPTPPALEYGMIRGMVQAYDDPYTIFVEPVQHELEGNTLMGSFGGIGVRLGRDTQGYPVLFPLPDSPAQDAGVLEGDRLISIETQAINPQTTNEAVQAGLRGPINEWVTIGIARPPDYYERKYRIKRAEIPLPSVTWHLQPDHPDFGIIEINLIAASTPDEIEKAVKNLQERGASQFILDLRDNSGGLLTAGVDTARLFLIDGIVLLQQYRGKDVETLRVEKPGKLADIPLAVLINSNTASAAEIVAGALKAHRRAKLVGSQTYGKDTIQLVFDLQDKSSLHVTSAHWWIPGLEPAASGPGIEPDLLVEASPDATGPDEFINAAINSLLEQ
jgi:carboxyl-terminal processing protease